MAQKSISWRALDHIKEAKSEDWFWIVGIVAIGLVVLAIFFDNILFALLIALATFASFLLAHSAPREIDYEISRKGIRSGDIIYPFSSLEAFWVIDEDGYERDRVLVKSKKFFMPVITIPVGNGADLEEVRDCLLQYLEEEEIREPFYEHLMHRLGF
ncbi:MAG TPA: hypothetical protein P5328_00425 [Candidatus Paceibacterota bacterium]|nr:hypothetical protein [Candidatus Paceibacterota bacterium]HRZ34209.1 hypothetical protein [Candidatus Paceibacterota bacterium]